LIKSGRISSAQRRSTTSSWVSTEYADEPARHTRTTKKTANGRSRRQAGVAGRSDDCTGLVRRELGIDLMNWPDDCRRQSLRVILVRVYTMNGQSACVLGKHANLPACHCRFFIALSIGWPNHPKLRGGGYIPALVSSGTRAGAKVDGLYQSESVLRLSPRGLGVEQLPGLAGRAPTGVNFSGPERNPDVRSILTGLFTLICVIVVSRIVELEWLAVLDDCYAKT
jgi:hypothetical protein